MEFIQSCQQTLQQIVNNKQNTLNNIEKSIISLHSQWPKNIETSGSIKISDLAPIIDDIHILCVDYNKLENSINGILALPICIKQLLSKLIDCTITSFNKSLSTMICKWINITNIQMTQSLKQKDNTMETVWRILICNEIISIINNKDNKIELHLKFTAMVDIITNIMKLLDNYDIQRIYSFLYYGNILWSNDFYYIHPKCIKSESLDIAKCKELSASFNYLLFYISKYFGLLIRFLLNNKSMNKVIFMNLNEDYKLFIKLQNENGFTIPIQIKLQNVIISYIRYCLFYEVLTENKPSIIEEGENIKIDLKSKLKIKKLLNKRYKIRSDLILKEIKKSRFEIMDYFMINDDDEKEEKKINDDDGDDVDEDDKIYLYLDYLSPIWKKEVVECHKIKRVSDKTEKEETEIVSLGNKSINRWYYYQKYASKRNRNIEKEQELENSMGDSWEYLFFSTRFEIYYIINYKMNKNNKKHIHSLDKNLGDIFFALFKISKNYRDYQKRFSLQLITMIIDIINPTHSSLHKYSPILLDTLRIILAYREDVITEVLYPLIIKLINNKNVLSISNEIEIYQSQYYETNRFSSEDIEQNKLILDNLEAIYQRINTDSNTLIHAGGNAEVLRKKMITKYYLTQLKREKILNVKRWNIVFNVILEFMINTDDLEAVQLCFEYINTAIVQCWMNIFSFHGKIILFLAKLCIKLDKYTNRTHINYGLIKYKKSIFDLAENTILSLMLVSKSEKQTKQIKQKLVKMKSIQSISKLIDNVLSEFDKQITTKQPNDTNDDDILFVE